MKRIRTFLTGLMLFGFFSCGLRLIYLDQYYAYKRYKKPPRPELGMIYPHNVHGAIVFLTQQEDSQLDLLFDGGAILLGLFALLQYFGTFEKNREE